MGKGWERGWERGRERVGKGSGVLNGGLGHYDVSAAVRVVGPKAAGVLRGDTALDRVARFAIGLRRLHQPIPRIVDAH